jgi:hypothetical protein
MMSLGGSRAMKFLWGGSIIVIIIIIVVPFPFCLSATCCCVVAGLEKSVRVTRIK